MLHGLQRVRRTSRLTSEGEGEASGSGSGSGSAKESGRMRKRLEAEDLKRMKKSKKPSKNSASRERKSSRRSSRIKRGSRHQVADSALTPTMQLSSNQLAWSQVQSEGVSPLTALAAATAHDERQLAAAAAREESQVGELKEMQESVQRLRTQRALVERIKHEAAGKEARIHDLEALVQQLRSKVSAASLQALERERSLRTKLLAAEQAASATLAEEDAMAHELRELLSAAQRTEGALRHDLARALAEKEEAASAHEIEYAALEDENARLDERSGMLEDEVARIRESAAEQGRQAAIAQKRLLDAKQNASATREALERELANVRAENAQLQDKTESLMMVHHKQRELLRAREADLQEAETRENLLQGTVAELEENARLLREQITLSENGDMGLRRLVATKSKQLDESEAMCDKLRGDLAALKLESRMTVQECAKQKESHMAYQHSLQNASVHRRRMEIQLESLSEKVNELQNQLVAEMQRSAALARELGEERKMKKSVSKQRLRLLEQFQDEENKLKKTLDLSSSLHRIDKPASARNPGLGTDNNRFKRAKAHLRETVEMQRATNASQSHALHFSASALDSQFDALSDSGHFRQSSKSKVPTAMAKVDDSALSSSSYSSSDVSSSSSSSCSSSDSVSSSSSSNSLSVKEQDILAQQHGDDDLDNTFFRHSPATVRKPPRKHLVGTPLVARKTTACSRARDVNVVQKLKKKKKKSAKKKKVQA